MLVRVPSTGTIHFLGEEGRTLCGRTIRESWSSLDMGLIDSESFCKKCVELENLDEEKEQKVEPVKGVKI